MHSSCEIYFPSELGINIDCNTAQIFDLVVMIQCQLAVSTRMPFLILYKAMNEQKSRFYDMVGTATEQQSP